MSDITIDSNNLRWLDAGQSYSQGTQIKVLRDDEQGRTVILKLPPGFKMEGHTHIKNEQHFVLKGQYEIDNKIYGEGTYQFIHSDMTHGPFTSKDGAEVLVIWH